MATSAALAACSVTSNTISGSLKTVNVYRSDNSTQCGSEGVSPESMKQNLGGIQVYQMRKDHLRGVAFPSVCGGATGQINVYTINVKDQTAAEKHGFSVLKQQEE
ncbi:hypothetical protein QEO94_01370 [Kingella negevensis]|uniref:hypothetical protein n=1 Tax=Kingella negevensis TaxID=1522312 RepID=UPI002543ADB3|nr:hypothetical protein [Kingella negevensis]WII93529.1 hypothetical protein QEO94_01370 [Kingella negevensis]